MVVFSLLPSSRGRFLCTVQKIEGMLARWFPHVGPTASRLTHNGSLAKSRKVVFVFLLFCQNLNSRLSADSSFRLLATSWRSKTAGRLTRLLLFPLQRYRGSTSCSSSPQEVTQVNAVSSSTDALGNRRRPLAPPPRPGLPGSLPPSSFSSPCLERLLKAKGSLIVPLTEGEKGPLTSQSEAMD